MPAAWRAPLSGSGAGSLLQKARSYVFGTLVEVSICSDDARHGEMLAAAVLADFDRLHRMLHAWEPGELVALNRAIAAGDRDIPVTEELARLITEATAISGRSCHLFNPAIGRLVGLWNFHASEFLPADPDAAEIGRLLLSAPRMTDIRVDGCRVNCANRDVQLDFGGYAKGYALDRAVAFLRARGAAGALINVGGNLMALGSKAGQAWRVAIRHPRKPEPMALLALHDGEAISTSGDYERFFMRDGRRYPHIIDPRSGAPAAASQSATTLVMRGAGAGALSDAASGALFVQGPAQRPDQRPAQWPALAGRLGAPHALLVGRDGGMHLTAAMRERLELA